MQHGVPLLLRFWAIRYQNHLFALSMNEQGGYPRYERFSVRRVEVLQELVALCRSCLLHGLISSGRHQVGRKIIPFGGTESVAGQGLILSCWFGRFSCFFSDSFVRGVVVFFVSPLLCPWGRGLTDSHASSHAHL